jgi:phytoene synthase
MYPRSLESALLRRRDFIECTALLRKGSRSFGAAAMLLPRRVREPATAMYAFCRVADDAIDVERGGRAGLDELRERLERVYAGRPRDLAPDRAFAEVVAHFEIPRALPDALLEGFSWDIEGRRYRGLSDLHAYAARAAGSVGAMMALVMRVRAREVVARACDLGCAMQLTNIGRDVGEDARAGRLYLPLDWLAEAGVDVDRFMSAPVFSPGLGRVIERVLGAADALYGRADRGIRALPRDCRPGIVAARRLYAAIGEAVARQGFDSVAGRARVTLGRKIVILARAVAESANAGAAELRSPPVLAEARFLVDAVSSA